MNAHELINVIRINLCLNHLTGEVVVQHLLPAGVRDSARSDCRALWTRIDASAFESRAERASGSREKTRHPSRRPHCFGAPPTRILTELSSLIYLFLKLVSNLVV